jgi:hypothetical protein
MTIFHGLEMESSHGLYARLGTQWLRYLKNKPKDNDTLFQ